MINKRRYPGSKKETILKEKRRFIRHPISYPLEYKVASDRISERSSTINMSEGGLLFVSKEPVDPGKVIILKIPFQDKLFKVHAKVIRVEKDLENPKIYDIGVSFYRHTDAFKVKLVEQLYLIDEYRSLRSIQLDREISMGEASEEWVKRYSKRFDRLFFGSPSK